MKMGLVYFVEGRRVMVVNLDYFELIDNMDRFNSYSKGLVMFSGTICCFD